MSSASVSTSLPRVFGVRQLLPRPRVDDIRAVVHEQLATLGLGETVRPGDSVAVPAGSRGIANIASILRATVEYLQGLGASPFLFPAMGSHGGGTAEGQLDVLEGYGITETACGCPIRATMETVSTVDTRHGFPVHIDRFAHAADHIVVVGRVKPHTKFVGPVESGLCKMMLIGMGKQIGAHTYHRAIQSHSFPELIDAAIPPLLDAIPVRGGLAIVENAFDETALIEAVAPDQILEREPQLLSQAKEWMPSIPFSQVDVVVIDEMGKNISGTGFDTNVVGRKFSDAASQPSDHTEVLRIIVRSLTPESHGNACGVGIADFITRNLYDDIDMQKVYLNCITAGHTGAGRIPLVVDTDRDAMVAALSCIGMRKPEEARIVRIKNTLQTSELICSEAYREEVNSRDDLEAIGEPAPLAFDDAGALVE